MPQFTEEELLDIIAGGESDRVEFKEALSGNTPKSIRETICAFANDLPKHKEAGLIFIGVKNDKSIAGLPVTDQLLLQLADMKTDGNILPPPSLGVDKFVLQEKEVALITVQPSDSPPVRCKGIIHIRTGSRQGIATAQDERVLHEKRRHGDSPFDIQPIPTAGLSDLNLVQFENEYLIRAIPEEIRTANDRSIEERLAATKMIIAPDQPTATVLGVLTIGKNPQDFLPGAYVQFLRIDGSALHNDIVDCERIDGAIPDLLRHLDDKLKAHNRTAVAFTTSDVEQRTSLYPLEALQQITRNAVMHRNYEGTNAPVRVTWFNDRIEVLSPGGVFGKLNEQNFGQPGYTDYRNPNLAEAMKNLGYVQRYGMGIPIARNQLKAAGHPEPEFDASSGFAQVIIWGKSKPARIEQTKIREQSTMTVPTLTFFNNKGGVGKTSLLYHLAWMFSDLGYRVLACDLDPQANLSAAFLEEERLEKLWERKNGDNSTPTRTIMQCVHPLLGVEDLRTPTLVKISPTLSLIPGDMALAGFEDALPEEWSKALGSRELYRPFRILTAFFTVMQAGAKDMNASVILADVGPNLGAINRSVLIATDHVIVPLGADLFSLQGLRNLGPTLNRWKQDWQRRKDNWKPPQFPLPDGNMQPIGYVVQQHGVRLQRPVKAYDKWINRIPEEYARNLLDQQGPYPQKPAEDTEHALATIKHYRSLVPMAQEARKPIFHLTPADGAIGSHAAAAKDAWQDFKVLANKIANRIQLGKEDE